MNTEFSKRERKLAGEIIEKGLHEDFRRGLEEFDVILKKREIEGLTLAKFTGNCIERSKTLTNLSIADTIARGQKIMIS